MYNFDQVDTTEEVRTALFFKSNKPEHMPLSSNVLRSHLMRLHYQALVWKQAICTDQAIPQPQEMGWQLDRELLNPTLLSLDHIPKAFQNVAHCTCHTGCRTFRCSCNKARITCTRDCARKEVLDSQCAHC